MQWRGSRPGSARCTGTSRGEAIPTAPTSNRCGARGPRARASRIKIGSRISPSCAGPGRRRPGRRSGRSAAVRVQHAAEHAGSRQRHEDDRESGDEREACKACSRARPVASPACNSRGWIRSAREICRNERKYARQTKETRPPRTRCDGYVRRRVTVEKSLDEAS